MYNFFLSHKANEENYIIWPVTGYFQVNDGLFDIAEGAVIMGSTACDRNMKYTSAKPMIYICIQAKEGCLGDYTMTTGNNE